MTAAEDRRRGCEAFLVILIASCGLLGASVHVVDPNQFAFNYYDTYKTVDESTVFEQGRFFLGVGHRFIAFPSNEIKIDVEEMSLRTQDGLSVQADIVFWYKLNPDDAMKIIYEFGYEYEDVFRLMVRAELRDIAAEFSGTQLTSQREIIAATMEAGLKTLLGDLGVGVEVTQVFLKSIILPPGFIAAIANTVVAEQDVETAKSEVEVKKISADTETQEAAISSEKYVLEAQAEAESATADADADADIMGKQASTRAAAYKELHTQVKAAAGSVDLDADQLLAYIFLDGIRDNDQSAITLGLDEPADLQ